MQNLSPYIDGKKKPVLQYDLRGKFIKRFNSILEAGMETGLNTGGIVMCCKGIRSRAGKYMWKYE